MSSLADTDALQPDWTGPLTPSGNLRRRSAVSKMVELGAIAAAVVAIGMLAVVVEGVAQRGARAISLGFLVHNPSGLAGGGGIANALLGTAEIVIFAGVLAVPVGVLTGLYLTEIAGPRSRTGRALKLALDLMQGLPTIIVALFIFGLIVIPQGKESGLAGSIALAIIALPLIARSSQEVLQLVPGSLREAADALGVARWRTVLGVILPSAMGGIATGSMLALARCAGETAPLLICNSIYNPDGTQLNIFHGVPNIPMYIYTATDAISPNALTAAWGAALVLLVCILFANIGARVLLARSRRKILA